MVNGNYVKAVSILVPGVSFVGFVFSPLPLNFDPRADGITEQCSRLWQQSLQAKPLFLTRGLGEGWFAGEYRGLPILSVSFVSLFSPWPPKASPIKDIDCFCSRGLGTYNPKRRFSLNRGPGKQIPCLSKECGRIHYLISSLLLLLCSQRQSQLRRTAW